MSKDNNIIEQNLEDTLKEFYTNYAYETIQERAIPNTSPTTLAHFKVLALEPRPNCCIEYRIRK